MRIIKNNTLESLNSSVEEKGETEIKIEVVEVPVAPTNQGEGSVDEKPTTADWRSRSVADHNIKTISFPSQTSINDYAGTSRQIPKKQALH